LKFQIQPQFQIVTLQDVVLTSRFEIELEIELDLSSIKRIRNNF